MNDEEYREIVNRIEYGLFTKTWTRLRILCKEYKYIDARDKIKDIFIILLKRLKEKKLI